VTPGVMRKHWHLISPVATVDHSGISKPLPNSLAACVKTQRIAKDHMLLVI